MTAYQSGRELAGSFGIIVTLRPSRSINQAKDLVESELSAIASSGPEADELRRVQNLRVASFFFALEHIGGFGGVADRLNAYNVFRGDPSLITTDVQRFRGVLPGEASRRRQALSRRSPTGQLVGRRPPENQLWPHRSTAASSLASSTDNRLPSPIAADHDLAVWGTALGLSAT